MKTRILKAWTPVLLLPLMACANPVRKADMSLPIDRGWGEYKQGGAPLEPYDLAAKLFKDPAAAPLMDRALIFGAIGAGLGFSGAGIAGYQAVSVTTGRGLQPVVLGIGGGLMVSGIVFAIITDLQVQAAVRAHNAAVNSKTVAPPPPPAPTPAPAPSGTPPQARVAPFVTGDGGGLLVGWAF